MLPQQTSRLRWRDARSWCDVERRRPAAIRDRDRHGERRERTLQRFRFPSTGCRMLLTRTVLSYRQRWREVSTGRRAIDGDSHDERDRQTWVRAGWSVGLRDLSARFLMRSAVKASGSASLDGKGENGERGLTPQGSAGAWCRDFCRRRRDARVRLAADGGRKRIGSASDTGLA